MDEKHQNVENKKTKKAPRAVIALLLFGGIALTGCQAPSDDIAEDATEQGVENEQPSETGSVHAEGEVVIEVYYGAGMMHDQYTEVVIAGTVEEFLENTIDTEHITINVETRELDAEGHSVEWLSEDAIERIVLEELSAVSDADMRALGEALRDSDEEAYSVGFLIRPLHDALRPAGHTSLSSTGMAIYGFNGEDVNQRVIRSSASVS